METIEYFNENGSDCYLLLLDASKAFDRVEYVNLFITLRDRNLCSIVLRIIIMNMYVNQVIQIKWKDLLSDKCKISNGVKQGGCLSPSLFSIYLYNLIIIQILTIFVFHGGKLLDDYGRHPIELIIV